MQKNSQSETTESLNPKPAPSNKINNSSKTSEDKNNSTSDLEKKLQASRNESARQTRDDENNLRVKRTPEGTVEEGVEEQAP